MAVNPTLQSELTALAQPQSGVSPVTGTSNSISMPQLLSALVSHISNDIDPNALTGNPANSQAITGARLRVLALATPVVTITPVGGAAGSQTYVVLAKVNLANLVPSVATSTSAGPTTLSATTYNTVSWTAVSNATQYDVYRTAGGSNQGLIAANITSLSINDTGLSADGSTVPVQTALLGSAFFTDIDVAQLLVPQLVTVSTIGTAGSTTWTYAVVADTYVGNSTTTASTTTGIATMVAGTSYNNITWNYVPGAFQYRIFRTVAGTSPSTTGYIGVVAQAEQASFSFADNALAPITSSATAPTGNTSGSALFPGNTYTAGIDLQKGTSANTTTGGTATLTTANMLCSVLLRSGGTTPTDTTPSAAAIIAALGGYGGLGGPGGGAVQVGMSWRWTVRNACGSTQTLAMGSGVTSAAGNTLTTLTVTAHEYLIVITNVTAGSEAITIYSLGIGTTY